MLLGPSDTEPLNRVIAIFNECTRAFTNFGQDPEELQVQLNRPTEHWNRGS